MPAAGVATLRVYNVLGQEITTLVNGVAPAGRNAVVWNGTDRAGKGVASGVYFYRFSALNASGTVAFTQVRKMLLMK
jgi:flagellar hook assembly protein FlgD